MKLQIFLDGADGAISGDNLAQIYAAFQNLIV